MAALKAVLKKYEDTKPSEALSPDQLALSDNDLHLKWKIEMVTSDGQKSVLDGRVNMPEIFAPHMLPESVRNFEATVAALFMRPVFAKFQTLCNNKAMKEANQNTELLALPETEASGDSRL